MTEHDVIQVAFTYGLFTGGLGFHYGAEKIGASVIPASTGALEKQALIMRDFKPTALACTPGYAIAIAAALAEKGIDPGKLSLKAGFLGAEPWSEGLRGQIESSLRITTFDNCGLTEILGPGVSFECEAHAGLHVNEDHFIVEAVDARTLLPVLPGVEGELVFTTITKEGFPLIRYRTGDLAVLSSEPCVCGRTTKRMSRVRGRIDDLIIMGASKVFPSQIEQILLSVSGLQPHYEILVDREAGIDTLEVRVEISESMPALDEMKSLEKLKGRVASEMDSLIGIKARQVEGETRRVVDKRRM